MTLIEVLGLLIAAVSGVAIPMAVARRAQQRELEQRVNDHAVEIARLKESSKAVELLHTDLRELRNDVREMTSTLARVEATLARD